jgi:hypothetical protein
MKFSRAVFVIHNMAHQGRGPFADTAHLELPDQYREVFRLYDPIGGEHMNIMKAGLQFSHRIVAVSGDTSGALNTALIRAMLHNMGCELLLMPGSLIYLAAVLWCGAVVLAHLGGGYSGRMDGVSQQPFCFCITMSLVCHWSVTGVSLVCHWCVTGVSLVCHWCVTGLSLVCHWCVTGLSLVCHWCAFAVLV